MIHVSGEHEFEAAHGLPEALPADEKLLWQGAPDWKSLARTAFHIRLLAVYFAALLALRAGFVLVDGGTIPAVLMSALWLVPLPLIALGLLAMLAWFTARTTVYTITSKRVVMRVGIVLSVTFNLPFRQIEAVGRRTHADGTGDIPLTLSGTDKISYLHLWPHARPWRIARTEPMLRSVPGVADVGALLARAIVAASGGTLATEVAPQNSPAAGAPRRSGELASAS